MSRKQKRTRPADATSSAPSPSSATKSTSSIDKVPCSSASLTISSNVSTSTAPVIAENPDSPTHLCSSNSDSTLTKFNDGTDTLRTLTLADLPASTSAAKSSSLLAAAGVESVTSNPTHADSSLHSNDNLLPSTSNTSRSCIDKSVQTVDQVVITTFTDPCPDSPIRPGQYGLSPSSDTAVSEVTLEHAGEISLTARTPPGDTESGQRSHMSSASICTPFRKIVSQNRRRYCHDGFNLDLTYITDRIIAMGYPADTTEALYRNSMSQTIKFLEYYHPNHYKVFNLRGQYVYDTRKFHNRVISFDMVDHHPPRLELMAPFCREVHEYLEADPRNVVAVHCKAGKGRTGVMICAYLCYINFYCSPRQNMEYYSVIRTHNNKGVTIPSQRRYVYYFHHLRQKKLNYIPLKTELIGVYIERPPKLSGSFTKSAFRIRVANGDVDVFDGESMHVDTAMFDAEERLRKKYPTMIDTDHYDPSNPTPGNDCISRRCYGWTVPASKRVFLEGDVRVDLYHKSQMKVVHVKHERKKIGHVWFNTMFTCPGFSGGQYIHGDEKYQYLSGEGSIIKHRLRPKGTEEKSCSIDQQDFYLLNMGLFNADDASKSQLPSSSKVLSTPVVQVEPQTPDSSHKQIRHALSSSPSKTFRSSNSPSSSKLKVSSPQASSSKDKTPSPTRSPGKFQSLSPRQLFSKKQSPSEHSTSKTRTPSASGVERKLIGGLSLLHDLVKKSPQQKSLPHSPASTDNTGIVDANIKKHIVVSNPDKYIEEFEVIKPPGLDKHCPKNTISNLHSIESHRPREEIDKILREAAEHDLVRDEYNALRMSALVQGHVMPKCTIARPNASGPFCLMRKPHEHVNVYNKLEVDRAHKRKDLNVDFKIIIVTRCIDDGNQLDVQLAEQFVRITRQRQQEKNIIKDKKVGLGGEVKLQFADMQNRKQKSEKSSRRSGSKFSKSSQSAFSSPMHTDHSNSESERNWITGNLVTAPSTLHTDSGPNFDENSRNYIIPEYDNPLNDVRLRDPYLTRYLFRQRITSPSRHPPAHYHCPLMPVNPSVCTRYHCSESTSGEALTSTPKHSKIKRNSGNRPNQDSDSDKSATPSNITIKAVKVISKHGSKDSKTKDKTVGTSTCGTPRRVVDCDSKSSDVTMKSRSCETMSTVQMPDDREVASSSGSAALSVRDADNRSHCSVTPTLSRCSVKGTTMTSEYSREASTVQEGSQSMNYDSGSSSSSTSGEDMSDKS